MNEAQATAQKIVDSMLKAAANDVNNAEDIFFSDGFAEGHAMALFFAAKRLAADFGLPFDWKSMGEWEHAIKRR